MRPIPAASLGLLQRFEGFKATRNTDPAGNEQIGYGHLLHAGDPLWDATISEAEAEKLALQDLAEVAVELTAPLGTIVNTLTDNQYAALLDFTYNEGIGRLYGSTLLADLRTGNLADVPRQLKRWVYGRGADGQEVELPGLVTRRQVEADLWLS
jgi:lysozyme